MPWAWVHAMNALDLNSRTVVGAHGPRVAAEAGGPIQDACDVQTADAVIDSDVHALVGEVVGDRQAADAAATGQRVGHEVHAPYRVGCKGSRQGLAQHRRILGLATPAHRQVGVVIQPVNPLVVHVRKRRTQQIVQASIAEPPGPAPRAWPTTRPSLPIPPAGAGTHRVRAPQVGRPRRSLIRSSMRPAAARRTCGARALPRSQPSALRCPSAPRPAAS